MQFDGRALLPIMNLYLVAFANCEQSHGDGAKHTNSYTYHYIRSVSNEIEVQSASSVP